MGISGALCAISWDAVFYLFGKLSNLSFLEAKNKLTPGHCRRQERVTRRAGVGSVQIETVVPSHILTFMLIPCRSTVISCQPIESTILVFDQTSRSLEASVSFCIVISVHSLADISLFFYAILYIPSFLGLPLPHLHEFPSA